MDIIYFSAAFSKEDEKLLHIVRKLSSKQNILICRTVEDLTSVLKGPHEDEILVILYAHSKDLLLDVFSFRKILLEHKLILIIPDREQETISLAHRFHPRYLTYVDSDFRVLEQVLKKIIQNGSEKEKSVY